MNAAVPRSTKLKSTQPAGVWPKLGWLFLLYGLLAIGLTWPVFRQFGQAVAGFDGRDGLQHVWYQWWLKETLLDLRLWPDRVTYLYYPLGAAHPVLALHPYVPLVYLPLTLLFGPLISYNLGFLLSFALSGLAGYLLCRYVAGHTGAAVIGGLIFAFYPNRVGHAVAGHLLLTTNYFLPLYALSLLLLLRRPSARRAIWHGVITALLALAQPTHLGYGIIPVFIILVGGYLLLGDGRGTGPRWQSLLWLAAAAGLALLIVLPFAWPMLRQSQQGELSYLTPPDLTEHATDLLAFWLPSPYNPVLSKLGLIPAYGQAIIGGWRDLEEQLAYPGFLALLLALLAIWKRGRDSLIWLGLTLTCALLSLGPFLKIGGQVQSLALPYLWLSRLPFFAWSRTPGRLNETVMLGVAVLAALGTAWLFDTTQSRQKWSPSVQYILLGGIGAVMLVEYLVVFPFPTELRPISTYYHQLATEKSSGGILELPVTGSRRASNYAMYYQTVHEHPLAGGYIERDPPGTVELKEFLNQLVSPLAPQTVLAEPDEAERRAILAEMDIRWVIAQPALMTDRAARATLDYLPVLFGSPVFEDEAVQVYTVQSEVGRDIPEWQLAPDQESWEVIGNGTMLRLKKQGFLFVYADQASLGQLQFQLQAPATPTELSLSLNDGPPGSYAVKAAVSQNSLALSLRPGFNYIRLWTNPPQDIGFQKISVNN